MKKETLTLSSSKGEKKIEKNKILFCKQYLVGTLIELNDGNHYLLKERLNELRNFLDGPSFFMISSRELINLEYMQAVFSEEIVMVNNKIIKVGGMRKEMLVKKIWEEAWIQ